MKILLATALIGVIAAIMMQHMQRATLLVGSLSQHRFEPTDTLPIVGLSEAELAAGGVANGYILPILPKQTIPCAIRASEPLRSESGKVLSYRAAPHTCFHPVGDATLSGSIIRGNLVGDRITLSGNTIVLGYLEATKLSIQSPPSQIRGCLVVVGDLLVENLEILTELGITVISMHGNQRQVPLAADSATAVLFARAPHLNVIGASWAPTGCVERMGIIPSS